MDENNDYDLLVDQYSQAIDGINETLGHDVTLFTNKVLSKDPYVGGGFNLLLKNQSIPVVSSPKKFFYVCKSLSKSLTFILLWVIKKILFNIVVPTFDFKKAENKNIN